MLGRRLASTRHAFCHMTRGQLSAMVRPPLPFFRADLYRSSLMPFPRASQALSRFTVLDLTRVRAGPTCARQFADWGANVIKIDALLENAGEQLGGPRHGPDFQNLHRNKRAMTLNLKDPKGVETFMRLVKKADVVIENFRPDVKDKLGIGYESVRKVNPAIVYGSISGFGQDGPYQKRPGFDQIAQGMGGLMSITGAPGEGPMRVGIPVADLTAGLFCAMGILTALLERDVSGEGQWVQTSLLQAQIFMLDFQAARWLMEKDVARQAGNDHPTSIPTGVFKTSDGYINIATTGGGSGSVSPRRSAHPTCLTVPNTPPRRTARRTARRSTPRSTSSPRPSRPKPGSRSSMPPVSPVARSIRSTRSSRMNRSSIWAWPRTCPMPKTAISAWSASRSSSHAPRARWPHHRRNSASRPKRYSPSSVSAPTRSLN